MTDTSQKLRDALQIAESALADIGDADREPGDNLAWCERRAAQDLPTIRQALALITADHIPDAGEMVADQVPDAGKMIETAAPGGGYVRPVVLDARQALPTAEQVGDINVAESFTSVTKTAAPVGELPELPEAYGYFDIRGSAADGYTADQMRAYARAALSAGDAVDAQRYRYLRAVGGQSWHEVSDPRNPKLVTGSMYDVATDAAMRKGQL